MFTLENSCHVCLEGNSELKNMNTTDEDSATWFEIIKTIIPDIEFIEINVPNLICNDCCREIKHMYEFRKKCIKNNNDLVKYKTMICECLDNSNVSTEEILESSDKPMEENHTLSHRTENYCSPSSNEENPSFRISSSNSSYCEIVSLDSTESSLQETDEETNINNSLRIDELCKLYNAQKCTVKLKHFEYHVEDFLKMGINIKKEILQKYNVPITLETEQKLHMHLENQLDKLRKSESSSSDASKGFEELQNKNQAIAEDDTSDIEAMKSNSTTNNKNEENATQVNLENYIRNIEQYYISCEDDMGKLFLSDDEDLHNSELHDDYDTTIDNDAITDKSYNSHSSQIIDTIEPDLLYLDDTNMYNLAPELYDNGAIVDSEIVNTCSLSNENSKINLSITPIIDLANKDIIILDVDEDLKKLISSTENISDGQETMQNDILKLYKCNFCRKNFKNEMRLMQHLHCFSKLDTSGDTNHINDSINCWRCKETKLITCCEFCGNSLKMHAYASCLKQTRFLKCLHYYSSTEKNYTKPVSTNENCNSPPKTVVHPHASSSGLASNIDTNIECSETVKSKCKIYTIHEDEDVKIIDAEDKVFSKPIILVNNIKSSATSKYSNIINTDNKYDSTQKFKIKNIECVSPLKTLSDTNSPDDCNTLVSITNSVGYSHVNIPDIVSTVFQMDNLKCFPGTKITSECSQSDTKHNSLLQNSIVSDSTVANKINNAIIIIHDDEKQITLGKKNIKTTKSHTNSRLKNSALSTIESFTNMKKHGKSKRRNNSRNLYKITDDETSTFNMSESLETNNETGINVQIKKNMYLRKRKLNKQNSLQLSKRAKMEL